MKLLAIPIAILLALATFPALFASGDPTPVGCAGSGEVGAVLATIRTLESGGDYTAQAKGSTASGAYQFLDATWAGYGGYSRAWQAPAAVQDAKAAEHIQQILDRHDGDISAVPVIWYIGHLPAVGSDEWDTVPFPKAGNVLTPRQYQTRWLTEYAAQSATPEAVLGGEVVGGGCLPGTPIEPLADGYAYPGPTALFAAADVGAPHHDYPAWDWIIAEGTPIYAVRGGTVITVQNWPHNWWDKGCGTNSAGCRTCGVGVTIQDQDGTHWAYCHGNTAHVTVGQVVDAGTQILTSGNTGRSGTPHLHIQITTSDGQLRCPQPLLKSLKERAQSVPTGSLPTNSCS